MTRWAALALASWFAACGGAGPRGDRSDPNLLEAERALLLDGDTDRAERLLTDSLSRRPDARAAFLLGDLLDSTGRPAEALPRYLDALAMAVRDPDADREAVASAMAVVAIRDRIDGFGEELDRFLGDLGDAASRLPPEALFQLRNLEFGLALKRGDVARIPELRDRTGCLTRWHAAGPFGPSVWEAYDRGATDPILPRVEEPWPRRVDLGPGRGASDVRDVDADTCTVALADPALPVEGVGLARTTLLLPAGGRVSFRLATSSSARVYVGGTLVHDRDLRAAWPPGVVWFQADLLPGATSVVVEIASPRGPPAFSLAAFASRGGSSHLEHSRGILPSRGPALRADQPAPLDHASAPLSALLAAVRVAAWWEDPQASSECLAEIAGRGDRRSPMVTEAMGEAALFDQAMPGEVAFEIGRGLMREALDGEPRLQRARLHLAATEAADGRDEQAMRLVAGGTGLTPDEPALHGRMAQLAAGMGWHAETLAAVDQLDRILPGSCLVLSWRLAIARQRNRLGEAMDLARRISECDAYDTALADELTRAQRFDEAVERLASIADLSALDRSRAASVAAAALAADDQVRYREYLRRALRLSPDDAGSVVALADLARAAGGDEPGRSILEGALSSLRGPQPLLDRALAGVDDREPYSSLRLDGRALIEDYSKSDTSYDTAAVWVLDRAVHLVAADGSRTELVHTIAHLKTDEAVQKHGELDVPQGALLLRARTIKKDGRMLEPEELENKTSISLPGLEAGDFIEAEFATFHGPSQVFPGGFDTERFFFQDFDTAFHRSEVIVAAPIGMDLQLDPRGDCPEAGTVVRGDTAFPTWRVRRGLPRNQEPRAPAASEYLPSIRVSSGASVDAICARTRDLLAHVSHGGAPVEDAVAEATRGVPAEARDERNRAIYRWVMEEIEDSGNLFEEAGHVIMRRSGSRARAFIAMLAADDVDARLVLVRPLGADDTPTEVPAFSLFERAVVLVGGDWVGMDQDGAPYGFLPVELRDRPAVILDRCDAVTTGAGSVPVEEQLVSVSISIGADGAAVLDVEEILTGALAAGWRTNLEQIPASQLDLRFQEDYVSSLMEGAALARLEIEGRDDPERPLRLAYRLEAQGMARRTSSGMTALLPFATQIQASIGALPTRLTPLVMAARTRREVRYAVTVDDDLVIVDAGGADRVEGPFGGLERSATIEGGRVDARVLTFVEAARVEPSRYGELLSLARDMDRLSRVELRLRAR